MNKVLKRGLSFFLVISIVFSSALVGLGECDFSGLFTITSKAADEIESTFTENGEADSFAEHSHAINNDFAYVEEGTLFCNGEVTYIVKLKGGIGVTGAVFGAMFDPEVLEIVDEKSGACTTVGTDGDEFNNFGGVFTKGLKYGTDNIYIVGNANTNETVRANDTAYIKFTFKVKDNSADYTDIDFYCTEFVGSVSVSKNDFEVVVGCITLGLEIPDSGHIASDVWEVEKEATVFEPGVKFSVCTLCSKRLETAEIPQLVCNKTTITSIIQIDESLVLNWDSVEGADSYDIYRRTDSAWRKLTSVDGSLTTYTDTDLETNVTYSYFVKAVNEAGSSEYSNEVSVKYHIHNMSDWLVRIAPTCTESGVSYKECDSCDYEETKTVDALGHNYSSEWTIDVAPTCTESGSKSHHCLNCDDKVDVTAIAPTGHISSDWINDPSTCTQEGLSHKECLVCEEILETKVIPAMGHTVEKDEAVEPTCTEEGKTEGSHCSVCNTVFDAQESIPAKGHISSGWIIDADATCTIDGSKHIECAVCDEILVTEIIPATGHSLTDWIIDEYATCTTNGSKHNECTVCGETVKTEVITAPGHTEVIDAAIAATCTTTGKTEGSHCSVCNEVVVAQVVIPAQGHTKVTDEAISVTCTTDGKTEGSHCSVCNVVFVAQTTIPATGHTSSDWKYNEKTRTYYKECTVCKTILETEYVPLTAPKITSCYNEVNGVQLKWTAVTDAKSYKVYYKLPSQKDWKYITTTSNLEYQDTDVSGNTIYQYVIKAVDQYGNESDYSAQRECRFIETPTLLSRTNAVGGVTITWEKVAGATSYRVYRRGAGTDYWFYLGDFPATLDTFTDYETANYFPENPSKNEQAKPKSGNYYRYTVRASYDGKDSSGKDYLIYSGFDTNGLYLKYVATPKLKSISNATNGLQIKWTAVNGGGDVEYRVYRRGAGSTYWKYLGTTLDTTWTDAEVKNANGGYYRYTVRAVAGKNGNGWYSAFDTTGLYLMRLANPTLNSAVSSSAGITVKWNSIKGATSYYVYRKTANSGWTRIAVVSGNTNTTYLDKTAKKGTTYTYTVRAVYGKTTSYFNSGISCYDKY